MTNHLLERYVTLGIRLTADNGRLEIDAPDGILTPGLVDELRQHKPALLAALTIPEPAPGPPMDSAPIGPGVPVDLMPADGSWDELPEPSHAGSAAVSTHGGASGVSDTVRCVSLPGSGPCCWRTGQRG
jgi:hypothetical protein